MNEYWRIRSTRTMLASKSEQIQMDQFWDCVTDNAEEIDKSVNLANDSFPPCEWYSRLCKFLKIHLLINIEY